MSFQYSRKPQKEILNYQKPHQVIDAIGSSLNRTPGGTRVIMYSWFNETEDSHTLDGQVESLMNLLLLSFVQLYIVHRAATQRRETIINIFRLAVSSFQIQRYRAEINVSPIINH